MKAWRCARHSSSILRAPSAGCLLTTCRSDGVWMRLFVCSTRCRPMNFARAIGRRAKRPWAKPPKSKRMTLGRRLSHRGAEKKERDVGLYGFLSVSLWLIQEEEMSEIEKLREQMPD